MITDRKEKFLINLILALFIVAIICCFTLYPLLCDNVYAEVLPNYINTFTFENYSASVAFNWEADSGYSFSDLANLPSKSYSTIWNDYTDFSSYKISNNLYNFCCYIPLNYGSYSPFNSITINGVSYSRYFSIYAYGSDKGFTGQLFTAYLLSASNKWYVYYESNDLTPVLLECQKPYDDVSTYIYFNYAFNSNITRITIRSNAGLRLPDVAPSVNQLIYTAFQSKNPTFLTTATYDGAYNAGYEDAKAKYNNIQAYQPGGTEYQKIYNLGKLAGESSNNTFFGLISAVIDAPIKAFTGLLNFEIFGVNIKSFLLTLFTIGLVIAIVKLFMGNVGGSSE